MTAPGDPILSSAPGDASFGTPLRWRVVWRLFVVGGPVGLLVPLALSLWVSLQERPTSVRMFTEAQWELHRPVALRIHVMEEASSSTETEVEAWVEQHGTERMRFNVPTTSYAGIAQTTMTPARLEPGIATLHIELREPGRRVRRLAARVAIVEHAERRTPKPMLVRSSLQHGNDSGSQPEGLRLDVIPAGRWLTQFENTIHIRVLSSSGTPWAGWVEVDLASGEFMGRSGSLREPVRLAEGSLDRLGTLSIAGRLDSLVTRFDVRVRATPGGPVVAMRRVHLVSHAGGARVHVDPAFMPESVERASMGLRVQAIGRPRPMFVDVFDPGGHWVGAVSPLPVPGQGVPLVDLERPISGVWQVEASSSPRSDHDSVALERFLVSRDAEGHGPVLMPLLALHRRRVDWVRIDRTYSATIEQAYLDWIEHADLSSADRERARGFLLDTAPVGQWGVPLRYDSYNDDLVMFHTMRAQWTWRIRWILLGGGGAFLLALTVAMVSVHRRESEAMLDEVRAQAGAHGDPEMEATIRQARWQALGRGLVVIAAMFGGLLLTMLVLETLLLSG